MLVFTLVCWAVARLLSAKGQWWHYPLTIVVLIAVCFIGVRSLMPTFFSSVMAGVSYLLGFDDTLSTINEALPLFWDQYGSLLCSLFGEDWSVLLFGCRVSSDDYAGEGTFNQSFHFLR
jgi:asparagine N-glycosylation enzyme membrane subunit Stt3